MSAATTRYGSSPSQRTVRSATPVTVRGGAATDTDEPVCSFGNGFRAGVFTGITVRVSGNQSSDWLSSLHRWAEAGQSDECGCPDYKSAVRCPMHVYLRRSSAASLRQHTPPVLRSPALLFGTSVKVVLARRASGSGKLCRSQTHSVTATEPHFLIQVFAGQTYIRICL